MYDLGRTHPARGFERPDYTVFTFPAASLTDGSTEEIEVDQALSLQGRRGRDFLGVNSIQGLLVQFIEEHLTLGTADFAQDISFRLASRTGAFQPSDPELLWYFMVGEEYALTATATGLEPLALVQEGGNHMIGEPFLYVAPRLFWRVVNHLDQTLAVADLDVRWGSVSVPLRFRTFIELLERFADVTLL